MTTRAAAGSTQTDARRAYYREHFEGARLVSIFLKYGRRLIPAGVRRAGVTHHYIMALSKASGRPRKASSDSDSDRRQHRPPCRRHWPPHRPSPCPLRRHRRHRRRRRRFRGRCLRPCRRLRCRAALHPSICCCAKKVGTPVCQFHLSSSWAILAAARSAAARPKSGS